jgi:hypothetical protein
MYWRIVKIGLFLALMASAAFAQSGGIDAGYRDLYNLQFADAHKAFADWQRTHPEDPLGPVSDAAAYLFSEFDRLHILQFEFFTNDGNFVKQAALSPDPLVKQQFMTALGRTERLAAARLASNPHDENALLASVLMMGLRADYLALIEKRNLAGLSYMKRARARSEDLLKSDPNCYDAYIATGVENYMLSLKPAPLRWLLELGGAKADKEKGIADLKLAATGGRYLAPYARLLLAVAALRDHDLGTARQLLGELAHEFPNNSLYAQELAKLN